MNKRKNVGSPLNRSIIIAGAIFVLLLSIVISVITITVYRTSLYNRYELQMQSIANYIEAHIDHDALSGCSDAVMKKIEQNVSEEELQAFVDEQMATPAYVKTQDLLDDLIDNYADNNFRDSMRDSDKVSADEWTALTGLKDVHYIYIFTVKDGKLYEICAGNTTYEKEYLPENMMFLGVYEEEPGDFEYAPETVQFFADTLAGGKDAYYFNESQWGEDYSLLRPLVNSNHEHYGLLAIDVSNDQIRSTVTRGIVINISLVIGLGVLFIVLLILWMRRNVTKPLRELENSVAAFADTTAGKRDPDALVYTPPVIKSHNEVASLAAAVTKLSYDMRDYVKGMIAAENEAKDLQEQFTEMNDIAYKDALTQVKNKAAFDDKAESLSWDIVNNTARFGIVMVDLNHLKVINDKYGHDKGNEYIVGSCKLVCDVYVHSPVYRIGGDEFLVVLEGPDYENREKLLRQTRESFDNALKQSDLAPWNRYSAAVGMAIYEKGDDVDAVFHRADKAMYEAKAEMKVERT